MATTLDDPLAGAGRIDPVEAPRPSLERRLGGAVTSGLSRIGSFVSMSAGSFRAMFRRPFAFQE